MKQYIRDRQEELVRLKVVQYGYLLSALVRYFYLTFLKKDCYAAHAVTLRYERIAASIPGWTPSPLITRINARLLERLKSASRPNRLADSYLKSSESYKYRQEFGRFGWEHQVRLKYPRDPDDVSRQGDLLLLKPYIGPREKGVVFIKYSEAFKKFMSTYDLYKLGNYYRIVLEPSFWGYCDPSFLLFINAGTEIIVESPYVADYEYIRSLDTNLIPSRLGAGDWIDPDAFNARPEHEKVYDLVMIASWLRMKRHELLFSVMRECGDTVKRVALIGYPWEGRTKEDILSEAKKYGVADKIDLYESIPRDEVRKIIGQSRIGMMLALREGANKGIYECFFSDVPIILSKRNIGVNREHINSQTGIISEDDELPEKIAYLLAHRHQFAPRQWALKTTGYKNATLLINTCVKEQAIKHGEEWTQDIYPKKNDPNAQFADDKDRQAADKAVAHLRDLLRN